MRKVHWQKRANHASCMKPNDLKTVAVTSRESEGLDDGATFRRKTLRVHC